MYYCIDTDEIPGFFLLLIISSLRAVKILFLSFTCEDIGVAMVTNMISQLQELQQFQKVMFYVGISSVQIYKINRALHGRLEIRILSTRAESVSHSFASLTHERYFQHSKIKFVSPRGHVISSISDLVNMCKIQNNSYFQTRSESLNLSHV